MYIKNATGEVRIANAEFINSVMSESGMGDTQDDAASYENSKQWLAVRVRDENFVLNKILEEAVAGKEAPFNENLKK